jgi:hypothetical protein
MLTPEFKGRTALITTANLSHQIRASALTLNWRSQPGNADRETSRLTADE